MADLYSKEAERGLIGSIILDHQRVMDLCLRLGVTPDAFYVAECRTIFETMLSLNGEAAAIDLVTVVARLTDAGVLEKIGGVGAIEKIVDGTPTAAHAEHYADIVLQKHMARSLVTVAEALRAAALDGTTDPHYTRAEYETKLSDLQSHSIAHHETLAETVDNGVRIWEQATMGVSPGLQTGVQYIDENFGGLMPGCLFVVSGPPGSAKSTLMRCIIESIGKTGRKVALCTTEQTREQMVQAMIAAEADQSVSRMNALGGCPAALPSIRAAADVVKTWPIEIMDDIPTRSQLISWAHKQIAEGARVIALDFLQDVESDSSDEEWSDERRVTQIIKACRRCAKRTGVPWIVLASQNYAGTMRYSGQIESDAWVWLQLAKADDHDPMHNPAYRVEIRKARFNPNAMPFFLYWHHGRLLSKDAWDAMRAAIAQQQMSADLLSADPAAPAPAQVATEQAHPGSLVQSEPAPAPAPEPDPEGELLF